MSSTTPTPSFFEPLIHQFWKLAAKGFLPGAWFRADIPAESDRRTFEEAITLEIVSHCWQYSHFLVYQLSSLALTPPQNHRVIMTVYYAKEDEKTAALLEFFSQQVVNNVTWNWQAMPKEELFRRGIGRNRSALNTSADWVWFTDCDVIFKDDCIDKVCEAIKGRREALLYPSHENITPMLADSDPMMQRGAAPAVIDIDGSEFTQHPLTRATGPMQLVHGDVARAMGYCDRLSIYQKPTQHWRKCYEDILFRWLVGSEGVRLEVGGSYRIRHIFKGRYKKGSWFSRLRSGIRRAKDKY